MAWFGRDKAQVEAEVQALRGFYAAANAAAESYDVAQSRVEEGDVYALFGKLRTLHTDYADDLKKRIKKLGGDPEGLTELAEGSARTLTRIQSVGSVRDLLIAMRLGEENGVAMAREALEELELSGRTESLLESYLRAHVDAIRDLSEQIALRGTYASTTAEFAGPQWLRYPKAGFWLLEGAVLLIGYLFGRSGSKSEDGRAQQNGSRTSPRAKLGGDQAARQQAETISREAGR